MVTESPIRKGCELTCYCVKRALGGGKNVWRVTWLYPVGYQKALRIESISVHSERRS